MLSQWYAAFAGGLPGNLLLQRREVRILGRQYLLESIPVSEDPSLLSQIDLAFSVVVRGSDLINELAT